ncbi:DUF6422 family protein [Streptomyces sp. ISL-96]|uniref:DUF6422 family protein n=1 Tax=Streptomyces sp. ISL-96 TaxID=2819191 RepID=UPI0035ABFB10
MSTYQSRDELTDEQRATLERAALQVIGAREEAAAMIRAEMEPPPDMGWFGSPCHAKLPFPPYPPCGCRDYRGDGGPCTSPILVPDLGEGSLFPTRPCGHRPSQHVET